MTAKRDRRRDSGEGLPPADVTGADVAHIVCAIVAGYALYWLAHLALG